MQYAALNSFSLLKFEGDDSLSFLQGQLSQDMKLVHGENALLASYSNPKGRVFSTFLFWQDTNVPTNYYALIPQDNAAFLQKRLSMFVLRAKVSVQCVTAQIYGIWGDSLSSLSEKFSFANTALAYSKPLQSQPQFIVNAQGDDYLIKFPSHNATQRLLWISLSETNTTSQAILSSLNAAQASTWYAQDILIALPWIGSLTKELFVAQSINQDAIGAVNFKKGCYPGQEVIARSHYLGNLKRRTIIAHADCIIDDYLDLIAKDIMVGDNPVGQVVNVAVSEGKTYFLLEAQLQAVDGQSIILAPHPNIALSIDPIPYSLEKPE